MQTHPNPHTHTHLTLKVFANSSLHGTLQHISAHLKTSEYTATQQHTATHCNAGSLHYPHTPGTEGIREQFSAWYSVSHPNTLQYTATQQHTATHRNAGSLNHSHTPGTEGIREQFHVWYTATHLNTLQHSNALQHTAMQGVYTTHTRLTLKIFANNFLHGTLQPISTHRNTATHCNTP